MRGRVQSERGARHDQSQAALASSVVFGADPVHPHIAVASKTLETHRATWKQRHRLRITHHHGLGRETTWVTFAGVTGDTQAVPRSLSFAAAACFSFC